MQNLEFRCGPVERECPQEQFDLILCPSLIYHIVEPLGFLHHLRDKCKGTLFLTSAVDLEEGNGQPMSRLDRYRSGAHGMWSFNAAMLRDMLATAGFSIEHETLEQHAGGGYFIVEAVPGEFAGHHIFSETIDQEFPINLPRRREAVRTMWATLTDITRKPVAIFGAGSHTPWMLQQVADLAGTKVACIIDDRLSSGKHLAGLPVRLPTDLDESSVGAIILSSWHQVKALRQRAESLFSDRVPILSAT